MLGQAFEILIPERIVYATATENRQTLIPVPGQTQFRVRIYAENAPLLETLLSSPVPAV